MVQIGHHRRLARHAARTPLLRQLGLSRRQGDAATRGTTGDSTPAAAARPDVPVAPPEVRARQVVSDLFPQESVGLPPLDWQYGHATATAQVDPGLVVDAARNVLLAYAAHMGAAYQQEAIDGRLVLRTARAFDGVLVTVWADVTPDPGLETAPAPDQPHTALPPSWLEMDAYRAATGREHPHASADVAAPHLADDIPTDKPTPREEL